MTSNCVRVEDLDSQWHVLIVAASEARTRAYVPYSCFPVGAAVRTASGRIFSGCNVENASYGLTVCAERVAIWKALSEGEQQLVALAVVTESGATPCGACRQVMAEFNVDLPVAVTDTAGHVFLTTLNDLLPNAFTRTNLHETSCQ
jgi:cytidine deaminase